MSDALQHLRIEDSHRGSTGGIRWGWLLAAILLLAVFGYGGYELWEEFRPRRQVEIVQVVTRTGTVTLSGSYFEAAGWVEPRPYPEVVSALVPGWITRVHVIDGDTVKTGDPLVDLLAVDFELALQQAKAERATVEAELALNAVQAGIDEKLVQSGALESIALEKVRAEKAGLEARLRAVDLSIRRAELDLSRTRIVAPADAVVLRRWVTDGQYVSPDMNGGMVLSLYHPESLQVRVDVNLSDMPRVFPGQICEFRVEAAPETVFAGAVVSVKHEADIQKNTVQVKVSIQGDGGALKPEMLGRMRFLSPPRDVEVGGESFVLYAPRQAILEEGGESHMFVAWQEGRRQLARRVRVTIGDARDGDWVEIRQGLDPSSKIITGPLAGLRDGEWIHGEVK